MLPTVPPAFNSDNALWTTPMAIYVPDESVDAYKTAVGWDKYTSKIYPISEYED